MLAALSSAPTSRGRFCVAADSFFVICYVNTHRMLREACNVSCQVLDRGFEERKRVGGTKKSFFFLRRAYMPWPMQRRNSREMQKGENGECVSAWYPLAPCTVVFSGT